jgi:heat shock protein HslJ
MASTMKACPDPIMAQATAYAKALAVTGRYQSDAKGLTLMDANNHALATFNAQSTTLAGTSWEAISYNNGKQAVVSVATGTTITAVFGADGKLSGNAGCNDYNAGYSTSGKSITIGPVASTRKMCGEAGVMDQEAAYLAALPTAATYNISGKTLELRTADGALVASYQQAQPATLAGTSWEALSYNNGKQAVVSVAVSTTITANFGQDGRLSGNAGCNDYSAAYQTAGNKITIGPIAATQKACSQAGVMDQEMAYLAALPTAATYSISAGRLELRTADGALVAQYQEVKPVALAGTAWQAIGYNNGKQAVVSVSAGTTITLAFGNDGNLGGNAGCNDYSATYQAAGGKITIGPIAATQKACAQPGVMEQEMAYLNALATAATYNVSGKTLELRTADGALAADYQAK